MKILISRAFMLFGLTLLLACCSKGVEDLQEGKVEKGYATGKVVNSQGEPISGVKILLDNTVFYGSYIHGSSDKNGVYRLSVQQGAWRTFAYIDKAYNGETYTMELFPDQTDAFDQDGAVRNFTWRLEGRLPWESESYCGGTVLLTSDLDFYEDEEDIELELTPSGPLIDGSAGRTLLLHYGDDKWKHRSELQDIPLGRYRVRANLQKGGTKIPLKIDNWHERYGSEAEFELNFLPKASPGGANSASIVIGF